MEIAERTADRLVVHAGDGAFAAVLCGLAAVCLGAVIGTPLGLVPIRDGEALLSLLIGAGLLLVAAAAVRERAVFVFDGRDRRLAWSRRRAFTTRAGVVPFDAIRDVASRARVETQRNPGRRIELDVDDVVLPLSVAYAPDPSGASRALAETIRGFVREHRRP